MVSPEFPLEVELKLAVAAKDLAALQRHRLLRGATTGRVETLPLRSVYFDTSRFDLFHAGISLRVREGDGGRVQTLKTHGKKRAGLFERNEVEAAIATADSVPDLATFPESVRRLLRPLVEGEELLPQVTTFVRRTRRRLKLGGTEMVSDLDVGEISVVGPAGEQRFPLIELELELVSGEAAALYELALALQTEIDLRVSTQSKSARGFELASGLEPGPAKGRAPRYPRGADLEVVIAAVVGAAVDQISCNERPAGGGDDPEGIHQMRVGARRLRSALSLFKEVLPSDQRGRFRGELRWLAGELGDARDLDVFMDRTLRPCVLGSGSAPDPHLKRLLELAQEERADAYRRAREAISSARYARLVLHLGAWIATKGWRQQPVSRVSVKLLAPARPYARRLLERSDRKVRRAARNAAELTNTERHSLRIEVKKLRYASEFLRPLFAGRKGRRHGRRLDSVQQVLGVLNDDCQVPRLLDKLILRMGPEVEEAHRRAAAFIAGWSARRAQAELETLAGSFSKLQASTRFWKRG